MRTLFICLLALCLPGLAAAAGGDVHLEHARIDASNQASLQRGAKYFHNYCLSCHSAQYMRYNRVAADLDIPEALVEENLQFVPGRIHDPMTVAMRGEDAERWFGVAPPDLTLVARSRGVDWLYTYLKSFYLDEDSANGTNNRVFENTAMPHVLWRLQGWQKAVYEKTEGPDGETRKEFVGFEQVTEGTMTAQEYDRMVLDLVNYLAYIGEPMKLERQRLGFWVLAFLAVLFVLAYLLKREYWKDVH